MKRCRKLLSAMLALCLILGVPPCSALAEESQTGLENFTERNAYTDGQFTDVAESSWYYENVKSVYELGLMTGKSNQRFDPDGNITIAETVTIAVRLYAAYHGSTFQTDSAEPWYQPYVDYAAENGIIQDTYSDYGRAATRMQFVTILSGALPESVFAQKNQVADNAIPDVKISDTGAEGVYLFYRAGILTGSNKNGTFAPSSSIHRSETAAIITRMVKPELRVEVTLDGGGETAEQDPEVRKALEMGIVPEQMQGGYDQQITYAEFAAMLDRMTAVVAPERKADWEKISEPFRNAREPMTRGAGAVVLFDCAMALKIDREGEKMSLLGIGGTCDMPQNDPLLPNLQDKYVSIYMGTSSEADTIFFNAHMFACRFSYGNGNCYMDYYKNDPSRWEYDENDSFRWLNPFTWKEAIQAAERLYETATFCYDLTPADEAICGVTEETLHLAAAMPDASYDNLPDWKGYTIASFIGHSTGECGVYFSQEEVDRIADAGFDFVRVPLESSYIFTDIESLDVVRARYVASMDDLVNWCAKRGIHICFDLHAAAGFDTHNSQNDTIFENEKEQELFCQFWGWMAEHYREVPSSLLSFNLMNEPCRDYLTDEAYSTFMMKAIDRIRSYTPDRLIFVDVLNIGLGHPVEGLANAKVAQAIHPYLLADGEQFWPRYTINGSVQRDMGELTIEGSFPAGTAITTQIDFAHRVSTLTWVADALDTEPFPIGGEAAGENGCKEIHEKGTSEEYRSYDEKGWSVTLEKDCKKLTLRQEGQGNWYTIRRITIETPSGTIQIGEDYVISLPEPPHLTVSPDGTVLADDPATLLCMDKAYIEERFQEYAAFTERTGESIMIQEFGANAYVPNQAALRSADDLLSVADKYEVPWCCWCGVYGQWLNIKGIKRDSFDHQAYRADADYEDLGNGWLIDRGMEEILHKHMKK